MSSTDELTVAGVPITEIAKRFGTPLYIYNSELVAERFNRVRNAFPKFDILYALKANPNVELASTLAKLGAWADVASKRELQTALNAGYPIDKIVYGGPGKDTEEIAHVLAAGVTRFDVESENELMLLGSAAKKSPNTIQATIRINPLYQLRSAGEVMGGLPSQFGIDEMAVKEVLKQIDISCFASVGIHVHAASQVLDPSELWAHYVKTTTIAKVLSRELNIGLKVINLGGGIGVPYGDEAPIDIEKFGGKANELESLIGNANVKFQLELGRFLVAESGVYVTRILDIKQSMGKNFIIVDGGISGFSRPAMPWAQQHRCVLATKRLGDDPSIPYTVVGRSCLSADVLSLQTFLAKPAIGDILVFRNAGAYGYSMTMQLWGGHRRPKEICCSKSGCHLIYSQEN